MLIYQCSYGLFFSSNEDVGPNVGTPEVKPSCFFPKRVKQEGFLPLFKLGAFHQI